MRFLQFIKAAGISVQYVRSIEHAHLSMSQVLHYAELAGTSTVCSNSKNLLVIQAVFRLAISDSLPLQILTKCT